MSITYIHYERTMYYQAHANRYSNNLGSVTVCLNIYMMKIRVVVLKGSINPCGLHKSVTVVGLCVCVLAR